jgi:diketogulonate reductase-like aldo/keto reductase
MAEMTPDRLDARYTLNQGPEIPCLGLGVFKMERGEQTRRAVAWALEEGYRLIDTAALYGNEEDVGHAVRASGIPREKVFVTTKLWHSDHGYEASQRAFGLSLQRLGLDYVDLYLIHWPQAPSPEVRQASWKGLEKILKEGLCRAIGVSNYTIRHLEELLEHSETVPAVNQVEYHPFVYDPELLAYCTDHGIRLEAYSPITRGRLLGHPTLGSIAQAHGKSPAQILIRWGVQHGVVEIPKSAHRERIRENADVFDFSLAPAEMSTLDGLKGGERVAWNPAQIP